MPDTNDMVTFLNEFTCKDGDIIEIADAGQITQKPDTNNPAKTYPQLNIGVKCNGKSLTWTPNSDARTVLNKKYGTKTEAWVGKKFQVKQYPKLSFGKTITAILPVLIE